MTGKSRTVNRASFIVFRCVQMSLIYVNDVTVIIKSCLRDDVTGRKTGAVKCKKLTKEHIYAQ